MPIPHRFARLQPDVLKRPGQAARLTLETYRRMTAELGVEPHNYNLLATRDWMLMVPRSQGMLGPVSVNSLGFAGSLVVQDEKEFEIVRQTGPWRMLAAVA